MVLTTPLSCAALTGGEWSNGLCPLQGQGAAMVQRELDAEAPQMAAMGESEEGALPMPRYSLHAAGLTPSLSPPGNRYVGMDRACT